MPEKKKKLKMPDQRIVAALIVLLSVVLMAGTIGLYKNLSPKAPEPEKTEEETEKEAEETKEKEVIIPLYLTVPEEHKTVSMASNSLKRDLTIFFTDSMDKLIGGEDFSAKLLTEENAEAIREISDVIREDGYILKALKESGAGNLSCEKIVLERIKKVIEENGAEPEILSDAFSEDLKRIKKAEASASEEDKKVLAYELTTDKPLTVYELFLYKREKDVEKYAMKLSETEGEMLFDEDADGLIYLESLFPGKYAVCFVPGESEYQASGFVAYQEVFSEIAYTAIDNIELMTVVYSEDEDVEKHNIPIEATLQDTMPFIESERRINEETGEEILLGWQTINGDRYYFDANGKPATGDQVILGIRYRFASDGKQMKGGFGIDISKWQGHINWEVLAPSIDFVIIRCGYRGSRGRMAVDPIYSENMKGAKRNGIRTGVYFYSRALNEQEAVEEASLTIRLLNEEGGCDLPVYFDMEDEAQRSLTNAERNRIVHAWVETIRSAGYKPGLYASYSWLLHDLNMDEFKDISVWVARYNTYLGYPYNYDCWQYSSVGTLPGIDDYYVDMNEGF